MQRKVILSAFALLIVISPCRHEAKAQTERTLQQKNVRGRDTQVPYLRQNEYRGISLMGNSMTRKTSGKSSRLQPTFGDLLSVESLDEVAHLLGSPKSSKRHSLSGDMFIGVLRYDGLMLEYLKTGPEKIRLRKLHVTSPKWSLRINGEEFRPGMKTGQLSPTVQRSIQDIDSPPRNRPNVKASTVLHVANTAKGKNTVQLESNTRFSIQIDDADTIEAIIFHRLL